MAANLQAELAAAIRKVNAEYNRLPSEEQAQVDIPGAQVDKDVDAAILAGDRPRAHDAIQAWIAFWLRHFDQEQSRTASPLGSEGRR